MSKFITVIWCFVALLIFVYSYGFVDLNLTLSSLPLLFNLVASLQHLVYFNRQLSLVVFIILITLTFLVYVLSLRFFQHLKQFPWRLIICLSVILSLAYPMLSSDVFKYLFAAKEILVYHANPYLVAPNTFESDTWIRFMRWVHTPTPYGPVFTLSAIPYYLLGLGKFVPTLYLFKLDQVAWYLLSIWLLGKMKGIRAQLFFAFNPLILMEWLVNAHNDAMMIALLLLSLYLYTLKKCAWSLLALLLSAGVKYVTVIFLPFLFLKNIKLQKIISLLLLTLTFVPLLYHYSWQYQPWYVTWLIPLAAISDQSWVRWSVGAYSFSVFSRYLFFVSTGSWLGTPLEHALMTFLLPALILAIGLSRVARQHLPVIQH